MSWELMSTVKKVCSCGKGYIIESSYMDDWNRTREESICDCVYCNEQRIKEKNKQEEMRTASDKMVSYFIEKYFEQWVAYFKDKKSKKAIWESVHDMKLEICSISTFYSNHHSLSISEMNKYYKSLIQIINIPKIIQVLNIKDEFIECELPDLLGFQEEQRRKSYNEAYAYYRKK